MSLRETDIMVLECTNLTYSRLLNVCLENCQEGPMSFSFYIFTLLNLKEATMIQMEAVAGLFGPATFVMSVIGAEMMMEVMVMRLSSFTLILSPFSAPIEFCFFLAIFVLVQLCYSVLGSTRTVVHNLDLSVPILKVTSKLFFSFLLLTEKIFE